MKTHISILFLALAALSCGPTPDHSVSAPDQVISAGVEEKPRPLPAGTPALFRKKEFNSAMLAQAANHYIAMGEARAVRELKALEDSTYTKMLRGGVNRNTRISWLCKILFRSKPGQSIRPPGYGALVFLPPNMIGEQWPLYPVAESEGVYFILSEGYLLAGVAEKASEYVDYSRSHGSFRKTKVKVPTRTEASRALEALTHSGNWQSIRWKGEDCGSPYVAHGESVIQYMKPQAEGIPIQ